MTSKNKKKSKNQKAKIFKNESYHFTLVNPKNFSDPTLTQTKYLDRAPKGSKLSQKAKDKKSEYSGLEHRQTLRTMTSIVICKLKSKIYS